MKITDADGWELMEFDPETGRSIWAVEQDDQIHIRVDQPVSGLIDQNRRALNDAAPGWAGDWHRIASVPLNVLHGSGLDEAIGQRDDRFVSRFLNDSDNAAWRVKHGRV